MVINRRRGFTVLAVAVGLLLITNPAWLFPHAGDLQFTYQRVPLVVDNGTLFYDVSSMSDSFEREDVERYTDNGTLEYRNMSTLGISSRANDFHEIDCEFPHDESWVCAFDAYLVSQGPIRLGTGRGTSYDPTHDFVHLDKQYYRRIHRAFDTNDSVEYDVERIQPQDILAAMAKNVSSSNPGRYGRWERRLVATGETKTSFTSHDMGAVYRYNGTFYTVVRTTEEAHRPAFSPSDTTRALLIFAGVCLVVAGVGRTFYRFQ